MVARSFIILSRWDITVRESRAFRFFLDVMNIGVFVVSFSVGGGMSAREILSPCLFFVFAIRQKVLVGRLVVVVVVAVKGVWHQLVLSRNIVTVGALNGEPFGEWNGMAVFLAFFVSPYIGDGLEEEERNGRLYLECPRRACLRYYSVRGTALAKSKERVGMLQSDRWGSLKGSCVCSFFLSFLSVEMSGDSTGRDIGHVKITTYST